MKGIHTKGIQAKHIESTESLREVSCDLEKLARASPQAPSVLLLPRPHVVPSPSSRNPSFYPFILILSPFVGLTAGYASESIECD